MATKTKVSISEKTIKDIRRETRRKWNAEEEIRSVLEGLRGEDSIAELCRREGGIQFSHQLKSHGQRL